VALSRLEGILKTRTGLYAFLAKMFLENPPREFTEDLKSGKFFSVADSIALNPEMKAGIEKLRSYAIEAKGDLYVELEDEFNTLFIVGTSGELILPFESEYTEMEPHESRLKAKKSYAKAGFKKVAECPEPDDHVALKLEFMRYLCRNQMEAIEDKKKLRALLTSQREHMEDLSRWVPKFCDKVLGSKKASFYRGVAEMTKGFLAFDREAVDDLITSI